MAAQRCAVAAAAGARSLAMLAGSLDPQPPFGATTSSLGVLPIVETARRGHPWLPQAVKPSPFCGPRSHHPQCRPLPDASTCSQSRQQGAPGSNSRRRLGGSQRRLPPPLPLCLGRAPPLLCSSAGARGWRPPAWRRCCCWAALSLPWRLGRPQMIRLAARSPLWINLQVRQGQRLPCCCLLPAAAVSMTGAAEPASAEITV